MMRFMRRHASMGEEQNKIVHDLYRKVLLALAACSSSSTRTMGAAPDVAITDACSVACAARKADKGCTMLVSVAACADACRQSGETPQPMKCPPPQKRNR